MMSVRADQQIVILSPSLFSRDAVGNASAELYKTLASIPGYKVTLLTRGTNRSDVPAQLVTTLTDLMYNASFLDADVVIYTYAIYSELFDILQIGNGKAIQIVRFHNVTPANLVADCDRPLIERSMRQLHLFGSADEIWADSQENVAELMRRGIGSERVQVMPLGVTPLFRGSILNKLPGPVRFIYVGRIVPAKGIDELVEAAGLLRRLGSFEFSVEVCGNLQQAPPGFLEDLEQRIFELDLSDVVLLRGGISNAELADAYRDAHVFVTASHHEGFCVPVIESLAAGCVPVSYDNSNLRYIHGGLGKMAKVASVQGLAEAMQSVGEALVRTWAGETVELDVSGGVLNFSSFAAAAAIYVDQFNPNLRALKIKERLNVLTCRDKLVSAIEA